MKKNFKVHDPFVLHLKIQHFVATPALQLLDYGTRYYYYLGIRGQLAKSKSKMPLEKMFEVIAMGIQAITPGFTLFKSTSSRVQLEK